MEETEGGQAVSDTPRTDSRLTAILDADGFVDHSNCPQRWVNHSRELERELNAANERIKRLEQAGDALKASGYFGGWGDAVNKWIRVKEDKA